MDLLTILQWSGTLCAQRSTSKIRRARRIFAWIVDWIQSAQGIDTRTRGPGGGLPPTMTWNRNHLTTHIAQETFFGSV